MFQVYKPIARDTAKARQLLSNIGIKINVRLSLRTIEVGRQCKAVSSKTALTIIETLESNGYKLSQADVIYSLINANLCDSISFYVVTR